MTVAEFLTCGWQLLLSSEVKYSKAASSSNELHSAPVFHLRAKLPSDFTKLTFTKMCKTVDKSASLIRLKVVSWAINSVECAKLNADERVLGNTSG